jgi:hypothetical protein
MPRRSPLFKLPSPPTISTPTPTPTPTTTSKSTLLTSITPTPTPPKPRRFALPSQTMIGTRGESSYLTPTPTPTPTPTLTPTPPWSFLWASLKLQICVVWRRSQKESHLRTSPANLPAFRRCEKMLKLKLNNFYFVVLIVLCIIGV